MQNFEMMFLRTGDCNFEHTKYFHPGDMEMSMGLVTVVLTPQTTCNWYQLPGPLLSSSLGSFGLGLGLKWSEILFYLKGGLILNSPVHWYNF